jgi:hypothetical protein
LRNGSERERSFTAAGHRSLSRHGEQSR